MKNLTIRGEMELSQARRRDHPPPLGLSQRVHR